MSSHIAVLYGVRKNGIFHCYCSIDTLEPEESLAQPTMLLAFCAEGFALQCYSLYIVMAKRYLLSLFQMWTDAIF